MIVVRSIKTGAFLYDGWADENITTMDQAKRDAIHGACLDKKEFTP